MATDKKTPTPTPTSTSTPKTVARKPRAKRVRAKTRTPRTAGQNGNGAAVPVSIAPIALSQLHTSSRVLTAAALSRDRAPLRSVEVPGLGPNGAAGVVFYRPNSTADFFHLISEAERAKDATPIEQIKFLVDHLAGRWCEPDGRPYTRDEILALEPSNLALISNAILYAKEITVDDHEALLEELGVPLAPSASTSLAEETAVLSPNGSGGAPSSADSIA